MLEMHPISRSGCGTGGDGRFDIEGRHTLLLRALPRLLGCAHLRPLQSIVLRLGVRGSHEGGKRGLRHRDKARAWGAVSVEAASPTRGLIQKRHSRFLLNGIKCLGIKCREDVSIP